MQASTRKRKAPFPAKRRRSTPSAYVPRRYTSVLRPELKSVDVAIAQTMNSTGALTLINPLQTGTGIGQRIGTKVSIISLEVRLINYSNATTGLTQIHRMIVCLDKQPNALTTTIVQVLVAVDVWSPRTLANRGRFVLLSDKAYEVGAFTQGNSKVYNKVFIKFRKPLVVEFNTSSAGTIADIVSNAIYLFGIGSEPPGTTAGTTVGFTRVRYTDV